MVKKINAEQFENEAKKAPVAVVDFSATWCGPCQMLAPVLEGVSTSMSGRVEFFAVDIDESPELAEAYNVQSVPCLILMKNGVLVDQSVGFKPQPAIEGWIDSKL
jgi:thioredoxin 1